MYNKFKSTNSTINNTDHMLKFTAALPFFAQFKRVLAAHRNNPQTLPIPEKQAKAVPAVLYNCDLLKSDRKVLIDRKPNFPYTCKN